VFLPNRIMIIDSKKKSSDFGILGPVFSCDLITTNNHNSLTLI
jgi:hypothetical protein